MTISKAGLAAARSLDTVAQPALTMPEPPMYESKPARNYVAKAVPAGGSGQFYGQFAFPGVRPMFVSEDGTPLLFPSRDQAEKEAALALVDSLNNRPGMPNATRIVTLQPGDKVLGNPETVDGHRLTEGTIVTEPTRILRRISPNTKSERYQLLTGPEFSLLLADAGITPTFFGWLNNTSMQRIVEWMDGTGEGNKQFPPHSVRVLLEIFRQAPETIDIAEAVTDAVATAKSPKRKGG